MAQVCTAKMSKFDARGVSAVLEAFAKAPLEVSAALTMGGPQQYSAWCAALKRSSRLLSMVATCADHAVLALCCRMQSARCLCNRRHPMPRSSCQTLRQRTCHAPCRYAAMMHACWLRCVCVAETGARSSFLWHQLAPLRLMLQPGIQSAVLLSLTAPACCAGASGPGVL